MAETDKPKRSSLGKKLGIALGVLILLVVVLYLVVTSTAFFKGVILPRVSKAVGADVTVADASIKPFSRVELRQLKVQPPNAEPILQAEQVVARYRLMDIIGGDITIYEATLVSPLIKLVEDAEGASNLDPVTKGEETRTEPAKTEEKPPKLNISNVALKNGTLQMIKKHKDGGQEVTELKNLNVSVDQLRNGDTSNLKITSDVRMQGGADPKGINDLMAGKLSGNFTVTLSQALGLDAASGKGEFSVGQTSGAFADLGGLNTVLDVEISPTNVKELAIQFSRQGQTLGQIRAYGPFDVSKQEGNLEVALDSIDKNVLNLVGGSKGMDFGQTKINSANQIAVSQGGKFFAIQGQLRANSFSVTQTNQTTPPVDLVAKYNLTVDQAAEKALIRTFDIDATQKNQPLLIGNLSKPMTINWGEGSEAVDESALVLTVTNLNLADWKAFAPELNAAGRVNLTLNLLSQKAGKQLQFDTKGRIAGLSAQSGTNKIDRADITLAVRGQVADLDKVTLQESRIELAQGGTSAGVISANGTYALEAGDADLKTTVEAAMPKLLQLVQLADSDARSGKLTFHGQVRQAGAEQSVIGRFSLTDLTGRIAGNEFQDYNINSDADIQVKDDQLTIRKMLVGLQQGGKNGGTVDVKGNMNTATSVGSFDVTLSKLNELGLRPFLASSLGDRKLASIDVNGAINAKLNSTNSYGVSSAVDVENLVILDPGQKTGPSPLGVKVNADAALQGEVAELRNVTASINYGGKPAGSIELRGNINPATTVGQMEVQLTGINENAVRTFMPKIGGKDLVRISVNGTASANLNSVSNSIVKADFKVADLVVKDPKQPQPEEPLSVQVQLDSGVTNSVFDLRQFQVTLSPTARAKNQFTIKGRLDLSNTNAYQGDLVIAADSLDLTQLYNLTTGTDENGAPVATPPAGGGQQPSGTAPVADPNAETEPMNLPKGKATLTVNIGQLYLREIAITNLQAKGVLATNRITLSPAQMTMNGAPMKADVDLNLGVPGYAYNVSFSADKVPLQPVANTFMPENRDQYQGLIIAQGTIKGQGTTGVNLRKNLNGQIGFTFTNANIRFGKKIQPIMNVVAATLRVPEVAESPINWVDAQMQFGGGQIRLPRCILESEALRAAVQGNIPIADVLTNSPLKLQVPVELRRNLARKLPKEIYPADTAPDAKYLPLPQFLLVKGTLGEPDPSVDTAALLKSAAAAALKDRVGGEVGGLLQGLLGTPKPAQTNAPAATPQQGQGRPQGATNQPPAKPAPKQPTTSTNQQPADPVDQILDIFTRPKK